MHMARKAVMLGAAVFLAAATGHVMQSVDPQTMADARLADAPRAAHLVKEPARGLFSIFGGAEPAASGPAGTAQLYLANATGFPALPSRPVIHGSEPQVRLPADQPDAAGRFAIAAPQIAGPQIAGPQIAGTGAARVPEAGRPHAPVPAVSPGVTEAAPPPSAGDCPPPALSLAVDDGAMLTVGLVSECRPGAAFRLTLGAMVLEAALDATGLWVGALPAISGQTRLEVAFDDVTVSEAVAVPQLHALRRVILWREADAPVHLNAFVDGASWGQPGHVRLGGDAEASQAAGRIALVSEGAQAAEIYSFAPGLPVRLSVEAEVTEQTCGRDLQILVITAGGGAEPVRDTMSVAMPDCSAGEGAVILPLDEAERLARLH